MIRVSSVCWTKTIYCVGPAIDLVDGVMSIHAVKTASRAMDNAVVSLVKWIAERHHRHTSDFIVEALSGASTAVTSERRPKDDVVLSLLD
jgi:hypothetical protein